MIKIILQCLEHIIGKSETGRIRSLAFSRLNFPLTLEQISNPLQISPLLTALETSYSQNGGQGIALQTGRSVFRAILQNNGEQMGFFDHDFRLQPTPRRLKSGMEKLADYLSHLTGAQIQIDESLDSWNWQIGACPACHQRQSTTPICFFVTGILQEYLAWASGDRFYPAQETNCIANGSSTCTFVISKKALEL